MAEFAGGTRERRASSAFEYDKEAWDAEVLSKAQEQLSKLSDQKYEDQAIHFINAYWCVRARIPNVLAGHTCWRSACAGATPR